MYRGLRISQVVPQLLPGIFRKVELVEGDGGVGTVLHLTFSHGIAPLEYQKEKFIKIDHENYVKEVIVVEGGLLDHGFQKYLIRIEIIGQTKKTSTIRSSIEYEVDDEKTDNASFASTGALANLAEAITEYVKAQKSAEQAREETA